MAAAINNNLGNLLTNTYATPPVANVAGADQTSTKTWSASCGIPVVGTDLAGSTYRFGRVHSSDVLHSLIFASTALTAGAVSLGLYTPNTGAVVSVHLFATSIDCSSAVAPVEKLYANLAYTNAGKRVWELLGLSSDPVLDYDVVATSTTGATVAGTLFCRCVSAPA